MNEKLIKITLYSLILFFDIIITIGIPIGAIAMSYLSINDDVIIVILIFGIVSFCSLIITFVLEHRKDIVLSYFEKYFLYLITAINLSLYSTSLFCAFMWLFEFKF